MKRLGLMLALAGGVWAQTSNIITLIPSVDATTGLPAAAGELRFRDLEAAGAEHYVGFKAPGAVSANAVWILPATDAAGCLASDGALNLSFTAGCGGMTFVTMDPTGMCSADAMEYNTSDHVLWGCDGMNWLPQVNTDGAQTITGVKTFGADIHISGTVDIGDGTNNPHEIWAAIFAGQTYSMLSSLTSYIWGVNNSDQHLYLTSASHNLLNIVGGSLPGMIVGMDVAPLADDTYELGCLTCGAGATRLEWSDIFVKNLHCTGTGCGPTDMMTTDTNQSPISGIKTFTAAQIFEGQIQFYDGSSGPQWEMGSQVSNHLEFWDSGGNLRAYLDGSGFPSVGGGGVDFVLPSLLAQSTATNSPTLVIDELSGQTVDLVQVFNTSLVKQFWIDSSGVTHIASCSGCSASDMMTTDTNQSVSGIKTFTSAQIFEDQIQFYNGSSGPQWEMGSLVSNHLEFWDSGGNLRAYLDGSGAPSVGGSGVDFVLPSLLVQSTATNSPSLVIDELSGQTADLIQILNTSLVKQFWVDSSGGTHIANCVAGCSGGGSGTVTSIGTSSPITGGTITTTGTIGCATCMVTGGGQTVSGTDTFTAAQIFESQILIYDGGSGPQWKIGSSVTNHLEFYDSGSNLRALLDASGAPTVGGSGIDFVLPSIFVQPTATNSPGFVLEEISSESADILQVLNASASKKLWIDSSLNLNVGTSLSGTFNMSGNMTVTQNFYLRSFSGAPSCSGVADGWSGIDTSVPNLDICSGGTLYATPLGGGGGGFSTSAWTSYSPTVGNLSSVTGTADYNHSGKTAFLRIEAAGTTNGFNPTLTLPFSPLSAASTSFACTLSISGGGVQACAISVSGSTMTIDTYNNSAWAPSVSVTIVISGPYETT